MAGSLAKTLNTNYRPDYSKMASNDRILVMKVKDNEKPISSIGLIDKRLFTGENKLHAFLAPNNLWSLKYEAGGLPAALKMQFTSFNALLKHARHYFETRNIEITDIVDIWP